MRIKWKPFSIDEVEFLAATYDHGKVFYFSIEFNHMKNDIHSLKRRMMHRIFEYLICCCQPSIPWRLNTNRTQTHGTCVHQHPDAVHFSSSALKKPKQKVNKKEYVAIRNDDDLFLICCGWILAENMIRMDTVQWQQLLKLNTRTIDR